ncbi:hypothetical protein PUMCH_005165 [Australozyma saopauloensis]|uniref:Yippee domain-containing protein n=1 Tax=Australozyma saopauloensis TaxID=291208 RepID=A0AAX4HIH2_9ASCO|nr:hypothetical protein PUMCH_005165 [[Candida] saopauloensis]
MGLQITDFFATPSYEDGSTQIIVCAECTSHLCLSSLIISDNFWGLSGKAYLVDSVINTLLDPTDIETMMKTGTYLINKIRCRQCSTILGWLYKKSYSGAETYKEGKFVIERKFIHLIPNNSATSVLAEQARILRRRRSSASIGASDDDSLSLLSKCDNCDSCKLSSVKKKFGGRPPICLGHSMSRRPLLGDRDSFDEHDEDANVFVDA